MEPDASESLSRLQPEADWTQTPLVSLIFEISWGPTMVSMPTSWSGWFTGGLQQSGPQKGQQALGGLRISYPLVFQLVRRSLTYSLKPQLPSHFVSHLRMATNSTMYLVGFSPIWLYKLKEWVMQFQRTQRTMVVCIGI